MSEKISEYATSVTALASGDLMDVSKLISTSPDIYQSQKLNYSLLLTELNADLTINNLGNSDLTSTTNARYFKLNGDATTNLLRVQNDSNQSIVQFRGDRSILIDGYTTNGFVKTSAGTGLITVSTQVSATEGGTGRSSWTANSLVYIGATNTFGEILAGTNGNVLTMVAGVPSWAALSVSLTSQVTGVLPIANGGTNLSALGSALQYLRVNSGGTALEYATLSVSNLGSANLTSADDARTFTLKTGTTTTQNLAILTGAGGNLTKWMGNGQIDMGSTSYYVQPNIYLNPASSDQFIIYRGSTGLLYLDPLSYDFAVVGASSQRVTIHANAGSIDAKSNNCAYNLLTAGGTVRGGLILQSGAAGLYMDNASGTRIVNIESQNGYGTIVGSWAVGLSHNTFPSGRLHVKGSGSTSATTTALFQNSSSSTVAEFKDDLTSSFGGVVTAPQIINTPNVISVTSNAGTITRAYRINKFTNSSAATMTITMSTTAALDGDMVQVRIYDFSAAAQTITWVNTENSSVTVPATSNGSTTLPLTVGFQYNSATSKWRCIGSV